MKKVFLNILLFLTSASSFTQELIDKIPIDLVDNLIFIQLQINNNQEPFNFIFDSGAGITVIDQAVSNELRLNVSRISKIGTSGKTVETKESLSNTVKVSDHFTIENVSLYSMDLTHISDFLKMKVDGIIGFDLLNQAIVETNISEMEMRFYNKRNYNYYGEADASKLIMLESNHFGLPLEIKVKGSNNVLRLVVKIDTGATNYLTFHHNAVRKYNLIKPYKKYKTRKGFGADSSLTNNLKSKISLAKFASQEWKNIPVVFEIDSLNQSSKRKADGLIGQEMLLDFDITYNLEDKVMYLEKR